MKTNLLKRTMAIALAIIMTVVNMPLASFATDLQPIAKDTKTDVLYVQHYDLTEVYAYNEDPYISDPTKGTIRDDAHKALWTNLDPNLGLNSQKFIKSASLSNDNYTADNDSTVFLNSNHKGEYSNLGKNAYQAYGFITVDEGTQIKVSSDDGVMLSINNNPKLDWRLDVDCQVISDVLAAGTYPIKLSYMNWGGKGKLIMEQSTDGSSWLPVTSNMFHIEDEMPIIDSFIANGLVANINQNAETIEIILPEGTNLDNVLVGVSGYGLILPASQTDFTQDVVYTATNAFGTLKSYTVTMTEELTLTVIAPPVSIDATDAGFDLMTDVTTSKVGAVVTHNIAGEKLLSANLLDVSMPGTYPVTYTATWNGLTATVTRDVIVSDFQANDGLEVGLRIIPSGSNKETWTNVQIEQYKRMVLLAQMQTAADVRLRPANLRNNILVEGQDEQNLIDDEYRTTMDSFNTFVEMADKSTTSKDEMIAYLASEVGTIYDKDDVAIGEAGTIILDLNDDDGLNQIWNNVLLKQTYDHPVVIAQLSSYEGEHVTHVRIGNVQPNSFDVFFEEWNVHDQSKHHNLEIVSYVVIEEGAYQLSDRVSLIANLKSETTQYYNKFKPYEYGLDFVSAPVVFSQIQSMNHQENADPIFKVNQTWMRQSNINKSNMLLMAQQENPFDGTTDTIGVVAIGTKKNLGYDQLKLVDNSDNAFIENWSAEIGYNQPSVVEKEIKLNIPMNKIREVEWTLNGSSEVSLDKDVYPVKLTAHAVTSGQTLQADVVLVDGTKLTASMMVDVVHVPEPTLSILDASNDQELTEWQAEIGYNITGPVSKALKVNIPDVEIKSTVWSIVDDETEISLIDTDNTADVTAESATSARYVEAEVTLTNDSVLTKRLKVVVTRIPVPTLRVLDAPNGSDITNWPTIIGFGYNVTENKSVWINIPSNEIESATWSIANDPTGSDEVKIDASSTPMVLTASAATMNQVVDLNVLLKTGDRLSDSFAVNVQEVPVPTLEILDAPSGNVVTEWTTNIGFGHNANEMKSLWTNLSTDQYNSITWSIEGNENGTDKISLNSNNVPTILMTQGVSADQTLVVTVELINGEYQSKSVSLNISEVPVPTLKIVEVPDGTVLNDWLATIGYNHNVTENKTLEVSVDGYDIASVVWTVDETVSGTPQVALSTDEKQGIITVQGATLGQTVKAVATLTNGETIMATMNVKVILVPEPILNILQDPSGDEITHWTTTIGFGHNEKEFETLRLNVPDDEIASVVWTVDDAVSGTPEVELITVDNKAKITAIAGTDEQTVKAVVTLTNGSIKEDTFKVTVNYINNRDVIIVDSLEDNANILRNVTINLAHSDELELFRKIIADVSLGRVSVWSLDPSENEFVTISDETDGESILLTGLAVTEEPVRLNVLVTYEDEMTTEAHVDIHIINDSKPVVTMTSETKFTSSQSVSISSNDTDIAKYYYTVDGSTPSIVDAETSIIKISTSPVTLNLNATTTVKAIAVDNIGQVSDLVSRTYTKQSVSVPSNPTPGGGITFTAPPVVERIIEEEEPVLGLVEFYEPYIFGYPDITFRPQNSVTRAEIATMFSKILNLNLDFPGVQKYDDVQSDAWYFGYVQAASRAGLFLNDDTNNFRPNEAITRVELASVFAKFWDYQDVEVNSAAVEINDITDAYWASEDIYKIYNAGIVSGYEDGTFRPEDPTLREHVVGMINTLIARPEFDAETSKFTDISDVHWAYGNIEAASQLFVKENNIPVQE